MWRPITIIAVTVVVAISLLDSSDGLKLPFAREEVMVSHPELEPGYERWRDYLISTRVGKLYKAYKDLEDIGLSLNEFDYNHVDHIGEGTKLMPGSA